MKKRIINVDYLSKQDKFNLGDELISVLQEDFGYSYNEIKNKIKNKFSDVSNIDFDDVCNLFNLDKDKTRETIQKRIKDSLGDSSKIEWWLNYFKIPLNDRMQEFQLFVKYLRIFFKDEKVADSFIQSVENNVNNINYFYIEKTLSEILNHTDSEKTNLPFESFFIATNVTIKGEKYIGFLVADFIDDKTEEEWGKQIVCFKEVKGGGTECSIAFVYEFVKLEDKNEITNFIYSFANFLNEREIRIVKKEFSEKNNIRRIKNKRMPLPRENIIEINGNLKIYYENLKIENTNNCYLSSWVRGHFFHFRNKSFWKGIYEMPEEELIKNNYVWKGDLIRYWKKPFIRGNGELKKSVYLIKK
jgi:hypothetical protein